MKKINKKFLDNFLNSYIDNLENIFEYKDFDDISKTMVYSIISKAKPGYKDLKIVKPETVAYNYFVENLLNILRFKVNKIKTIKQTDSYYKMLNTSGYYIDYDKKQILCIQKETVLLKAIIKLGINKINFTQDNLVNTCVNEMVSLRFAENEVEALRDFSGYCWTIANNEIEEKIPNVVFQLFQILLSNNFFENIFYSKTKPRDVLQKINFELSKEFGNVKIENLITTFLRICVLYSININKIPYAQASNTLLEILEEENNLKNPNTYLQNIQTQRQKISEMVNNYRYILSNPHELQTRFVNYSQYEAKANYNDFVKNIKMQLDLLVNEFNEMSQLLDPQTFNKYVYELQIQKNIFSVIQTNNLQQSLYMEYMNFINCFIDLMIDRIKKIDTIKYLNYAIYNIRYFLQLFETNELQICDDINFKNSIEVLKNQIFNKSVMQNRVNYFSNNPEISKQIFTNVFEINVIDLEKVYVKLKKENTQEGTFVEAVYYDEDQIVMKRNVFKIEDKTDEKKYDLRLNKKVKLLF